MLRTGNGGASPYEKLALGIAGRSSYSMHQERRDMIRKFRAASMMLHGMLLNDFSILSSLLFA